MTIQKLAVIGCGQMGLGIAESAAAAGVEVVAVKLTPGDLPALRAKVERGLTRRVERGKLAPEARDALLGRIRFTSDLADLAGSELVIESCVEELAIKSDVLVRIEALLGPEAVLASNTSSLRLRDLSRALRRPQRFVGLHFFNPAAAMKLVELSPTSDTASAVTSLCEAFCQQIGKNPVRIQDSSGYVVNRLLVPYLLNAIETLEAGVADAEAIDTAMKLGCGHPMGPLALADLIGLDVVLAMAKTMHGELRDSRYRAPSLLRQLVLAGHLGRKTGRGVYDYADPSAPVVNAAAQPVAVVATGS